MQMFLPAEHPLFLNTLEISVLVKKLNEVQYEMRGAAVIHLEK